MRYYFDRIDRLGEVAEEALEEIPTTATEQELLAKFADSYNRYEDCVNMINAIRSELETKYPSF